MLLFSLLSNYYQRNSINICWYDLSDTDKNDWLKLQFMCIVFNFSSLLLNIFLEQQCTSIFMIVRIIHGLSKGTTWNFFSFESRIILIWGSIRWIWNVISFPKGKSAPYLLFPEHFRTNKFILKKKSSLNRCSQISLKLFMKCFSLQTWFKF